jgi:hypothetical protein
MVFGVTYILLKKMISPNNVKYSPVNVDENDNYTSEDEDVEGQNKNYGSTSL